MKVELIPFDIPQKVNGHLKIQGEDKLFSFELSELDGIDLGELCETFRKSVFLAAGKLDPRPSFTR